MKNEGVGALDVAGQLAQRLAHQASLQARQLITHLALDFGLRGQRGNRVDHQDVDRTGTDQHVGDFQRLLTGIRLRQQQVVHVHAQLGGVDRVQRVLGVDEGCGAAHLLAFGDGLQGQRGLARGFRPVDFNDTALRQTANAQRDVEHQRTGRNGFDGLDHAVAHAHHRALAELLFDLAQSCSEGALLVLVHRIGPCRGRVVGGAVFGGLLCHGFTLSRTYRTG